MECHFSWQAQHFVKFWEIAGARSIVFFHTTCVAKMGRVSSRKWRVRDDDFIVGSCRLSIGGKIWADSSDCQTRAKNAQARERRSEPRKTWELVIARCSRKLPLRFAVWFVGWCVGWSRVFRSCVVYFLCFSISWFCLFPSCALLCLHQGVCLYTRMRHLYKVQVLQVFRAKCAFPAFSSLVCLD